MNARLTFDSLLDCQLPSMVELSPQGDRIAFTVSPGAGLREGGPQRELWVGAPAADRVAPVPGVLGAAFPRWSHDGRRLAFGEDPTDSGILRLSVREPTGEVGAIGAIPGSIERIRWSMDGSRLLVLAADPGLDATAMTNWTRIEPPGGRPDPSVLPSGLYRRLFLVDVETGSTNEVGPPALNIWDFDWSGDGEVAAIVSRDSRESASYSASIALIDIDTRDARIVYEAEWQMQSPAISADGQVAFVEGWCSDRDSGGGSPRLLDVVTGKATIISRELHERHHVQRLRWISDGTMFYVGQSGLETMCGRLTVAGEALEIWKGPATLGETHHQEASISADGAVVAACVEAPGSPPEVMVLDVSDPRNWKSVSAINGSLRSIPTPRWERVTWQSDGHEIEGILVTPEGRAESRLPVILFAHGGPSNAWTMNFSFGYSHMGIPLVNRGYALLLPNPRGSTGRGQDFVQANHGKHGPAELADFIAGIESLHDAGIVDRDRAGIIGASAGGYLSAYSAVCSDAFRASVPTACISDWLSFHLTSSVGGIDEILLQSDPYDPDGNHLRLSPVAHARRANTPTLILHGALDVCCPIGQAQELYQSLVDADVEAELVIYESTGHDIVYREDMIDMWTRVCQWFDRHLAVADDCPPQDRPI